MGDPSPLSVPYAVDKTIKLPFLEDAVPVDSSAVPEDVVDGYLQDACNNHVLKNANFLLHFLQIPTLRQDLVPRPGRRGHERAAGRCGAGTDGPGSLRQRL